MSTTEFNRKLVEETLFFFLGDSVAHGSFTGSRQAEQLFVTWLERFFTVFIFQ